MQRQKGVPSSNIVENVPCYAYSNKKTQIVQNSPIQSMLASVEADVNVQQQQSRGSMGAGTGSDTVRFSRHPLVAESVYKVSVVYLPSS
jgi:hypothetical protein